MVYGCQSHDAGIVSRLSVDVIVVSDFARAADRPADRPAGRPADRLADQSTGQSIGRSLGWSAPSLQPSTTPGVGRLVLTIGLA